MELEKNYTSTLAKYAVGMKYEDIPENVIHETKRVFMDIVGCGLGSQELDKGRIGKAMALQMGGPEDSTVIGSGEKLSVVAATYANAELMHSMDYNAITPPMYIAPFVCPTALSVAEKYDCSGKELLTALAAGFDIGSRIGLALPSMRDKSKPVKSYGSGCMAFGAAAAAGKMMGLDDTQMTDAFGLAGYFVPVPAHTKYMNTMNNGAMKFGPAGCTAQAGLQAAILASLGEHGDRSVLDGDYGFWAMNGSQACDWDTMTANLGSDWKILQSKFKSLPADGMFQTSLRVLMDLVEEHDLKPEEIEYVLVRAEENAFMPQFVSTNIETNVDASMSFPYCVSVAVHRVPVSPRWQHRDTFTNPSIVEFMKNKTRFEVYPYAEETRRQEIEIEKKPYINRRPAEIEISARGKKFTARGEYAYWLSAETPEFTAKDEDLIKKFHSNTSVTPMSREQSAKAVELLMNLEKVDKVRDLIKALVW